MYLIGEWILLFSCIIIAAHNEDWTVGSIEFIGNNVFSSEKLLAQMELQPPGLFSKKKYSFLKLTNDIQSIKNHYRLKGYRFTNISIDRIFRNTQYQVVEIRLLIDEGIRTVVDTIKFHGNNVFNNDSLLKMLSYKIEDPFDSIAVEKGTITIIDSLKSLGFWFCNVFQETSYNNSQSEAEITYHIKEGPVVRAGKIDFYGYDKVKKDVIINEVNLKRGEIISSNKMQNSILSLYNTGLFNLVDIEVADTPSQLIDFDTVDVPINIKVSESKAFELITGFGYSTDDQLYGNVSISYRNLFGYGHQVSLITQASFDILSSEISYIYPRLFGSRSYLDINGYWQRIDETTFSGSFGGVIVGLNRLTGRSNRYRIYLETDRVFWISDKSSIDSIHNFSADNSFILGLTAVFDSRRPVFNPDRGIFLNVNTEISGFDIIPWSSNFYRVTADFRFFYPSFVDFLSFYSSFYTGYIHGFAGDEVPIQEQFFFGSQAVPKIKGYTENELQIRDENGDATGGNFVLVITPLEISFPIYGIFNGVFFLEGGKVLTDLDLFNIDNFFWSAGPGIKMITPIGPIRLDYGIKLDGKLPLDGRFSLEIGAPF